MGLGDAVGALRLGWLAQAGLATALLGFGALLVSLVLRRNRAAFERARWLPLAIDGDPRDDQGGQS